MHHFTFIYIAIKLNHVTFKFSYIETGLMFVTSSSILDSNSARVLLWIQLYSNYAKPQHFKFNYFAKTLHFKFIYIATGQITSF